MYFVELLIITLFLIKSMIQLTQTCLRFCNITHISSCNNRGTITISNSYKQWVFTAVMYFLYLQNTIFHIVQLQYTSQDIANSVHILVLNVYFFVTQHLLIKVAVSRFSICRSCFFFILLIFEVFLI
jgi:hypothetical protein